MPELPEVEVVCQGLRPILTGRTIKKIAFSIYPLRLPVPKHEIKKWLQDQQISNIQRRAKYIIISTHNQAKLIIHLGMTGKLGIFPTASHLARHDHLHLQLDNETELRFNDTRRFGSVQIISPTSTDEHIFAALGPEPLQDKLTPEYLQKRASKRKQPLKNFLLDSRMVAGIGNIYANEIAFASKISPQRPVGEITLSEWRNIITQTRDVLKRAIDAGGSTIADFIGANGQPGYFQLQLKVYGRPEQPCQICGSKIKKIVMAGRATFWCAMCQK